MDEQLVCLVELLQRQIELLDDGGAVMTSKGFVCLTNDVVHNVVRTFDGHLKRKQGS